MAHTLALLYSSLGLLCSAAIRLCLDLDQDIQSRVRWSVLHGRERIVAVKLTETSLHPTRARVRTRVRLGGSFRRGVPSNPASQVAVGNAGVHHVGHAGQHGGRQG